MRVNLHGGRSKPVLTDYSASAVFLCVLFLFRIPVSVHADQFSEALWILPREASIDLQCKADLVRKYQPLVSLRWFKDGTAVDPSERIEVENLGTLRITKPNVEDHGLYVCQISHWDIVVTSNQIRLHAAPPETPLGENDSSKALNNVIMGLPNIWAMSIVLSTGITSIWFSIVLLLRLRRVKCCGKD